MPAVLRRLAAGGLLVTAGLLASPSAVPVYDGIGVPDEPYRLAGRPGKAATVAVTSSPVRDGVSTNGLALSSAEVGPQVSVFVPAGALAVAGPGPSAVTVRVAPVAPTGQPTGATIDGNVYVVSLSDPAGRVTLTTKAALASFALRATTARQPGPVMEHRSGQDRPWTMLATSRGGQDIYVASFAGPGEYALAFPLSARPAARSPVPFVLAGVLALLVLLVLVVRLRARRAQPP